MATVPIGPVTSFAPIGAGSGVAAGIGAVAAPVAAIAGILLGINSLANSIRQGHTRQNTSKAQEDLGKLYQRLDSEITAARNAGTLSPEQLMEAQESAINGWNGLSKFLMQSGSAGAAGRRTMSWVPTFLRDLGLPQDRISNASNGQLWPDNGGQGAATRTTSYPDDGSDGGGIASIMTNPFTNQTPGPDGRAAPGIIASVGRGLWDILTGGNKSTTTPGTTGAPGTTPTRGQQIAQILLQKGIPIAGALLSSLLSNRQTPEEEDALAQLIAGSKSAQAAGTEFLDASKGPLNRATGFWQSILNGGPSATAVLGPDIRKTGERYDETLKAQRELAPRSGMADQRASDLPFEKARETTDLYQTLLSDAPRQLATVGTNMAHLGFAGLTGGASGASQLLGYETGRRRDATGFGVNAGTSLAKILFGGG